MKARQKFIPIDFVYDDLGSEIFDDIVESNEYCLTRKERKILGGLGPQLVELTKECDLYELGSGSAKKTAVLFR